MYYGLKKKEATDSIIFDRISLIGQCWSAVARPWIKKSAKIEIGIIQTNYYPSIPAIVVSFFSFFNFDKINHLSFHSQSLGDYIVGTYFRSRYRPMAG